MATKPSDDELVRFKEPLMANEVYMEALVQLLVEKGTQFVTGTDLPISGLLNGIGHDSSLGRFVCAVLDIGFAAVLIDDGIDTALFDGFLVSVEGITGEPHDTAGFGNVAKLLGQIQQSDLVFDDGFGTIQHEGYLLRF